MMHLCGQCSFPLTSCAHSNISAHAVSFFVFLIDAKPPPKAVNCSGNVATFTMVLLQDFDAFEEELNIEVECGEVQGGSEQWWLRILPERE